jgi:hypothetical protein
MLRRNLQKVLLILASTYTIGATLLLLAYASYSEGLSLDLVNVVITGGPVLFGIVGGVPLLAGFMISAKTLGWLRDRLGR